jgi:tRNA(Ile)-lysidine synthase
MLNLLESKPPYLLAVSGGRDSMALLHLCNAAKLEFVVAHLDHALREDSSQDADFVRQVCQNLEIGFVCERIEVASIAQKRGWSLEEAARNVRYEFLHRAAKKYGCNTILTAHTLEDNAETVLLQLLRGSGRATGIPKRNKRVLRPLLEISKTKLESHLLEQNFSWREDPSNQDQHFTRNWLRLEILPRLSERFPNATQALCNFATINQAEDALLERLSILPDHADLRLQSQAIQRRAIRQLLEQAGINADFWHIERLRHALERGEVTRVSLPQGVTGVVQNGKITTHSTIGANHRSPRTRGLTPRSVGGGVFALPTSNPSLQAAQNAFPAAIWRTRQAGDTITLSGGTKKFAQVLIDKKISRERRDHIPVLALGSRILYVALEPPLVDATLPHPHDPELEAMLLAIKTAKEATTRGEVPVGAVVLYHDQPIAQASNTSFELSDMTRHAELEVLRLAVQKLGTPYLTDCTLVVTLEPCLMCFGAALEARIGRIVFAARNPKNGALGGVLDASQAAWNHRFTVRAGLLEREAAKLLSDFFAQKRG